MGSLLVALLLLVQEPSVAELLRRLDTGDIDIREKTEVELAARGAPALAEVEAAFASTDSVEFRIRLKRVVRKLRLADLTSRIPSQFSEGFRTAAPALMEQLKKADPGALIEAIAATTGRALHWELVESKSLQRMKVPREITREPLKGSTRADAAEVIRLALRAAPDPPRDPPWSAVFASAWQAIKPGEREDRRRLFPEMLPHRENVEWRRLLLSMIPYSREPEDSPILLSSLDLADPDFQKRAAESLVYVNAGPHAPEFEKRLGDVKPPLRRYLLYPLKLTGDRRFLKTFEEYLHSSEGDERIICLEALRKMAPESLPGHYLKWIRSEDPDRMKSGLQFSLGMPNNPGPAPSADLLAEAGRIYKSTKDGNLRSLAFQILGRGPAGPFRELVLEALGDDRPEFRMLGIGAARNLTGDDVRKALLKLADGTDDLLALEALTILLYQPSPPPLDRVRTCLKSKDTKVRRKAMYLLAQKLNEKARDELIPMLDDPDPAIQRDALQLLGGNAKGLEEKVRGFLDSKDDYTVLIAARILSGLGDKSCLPAIRKGLKSHRYDDYLPCLIQISEPGWTPILTIAFKIPDKDATVKDVVEGIRTALKEKSVDVRFELPEEKLGQKFFVPGISKEGWPLGWVRTMIQGSDYYFDGKVLYILPRAEARKRWNEWAKTK